MAEDDPRFQIIAPTNNIRTTLEKVGYPFKSKEHSLRVYEWHKGKRNTRMIDRYLNEKGRYACPSKLKYQFTDDFKLKISQYCCAEMKKKPAKKWMKENNRSITITGMMREEGGQRSHIDCIVTRNGEVTKFHPLSKVTHEWEKWFIDEYKIELAKLYYDPFNFDRSGCKGCPFNPMLQEDLSILEKYLPNERSQCEIIFKPVYDEYRRIGYRLKSEEQTKLF